MSDSLIRTLTIEQCMIDVDMNREFISASQDSILKSFHDAHFDMSFAITSGGQYIEYVSTLKMNYVLFL